MEPATGETPFSVQSAPAQSAPPAEPFSGSEAPPQQPGPTRRRAGLKVLTVAVAVVVIAGGSFLIFGRHTSADAAVTDAVNSALADHTADVVISGSVGTGASSVALSGTGSIDFEQNAAQMTIKASGGLQDIQEQAIYLNKVIYLNIGNEIGQVLPGKSWVSLDLSQLSGGASSSLGNSSGLNSDPAAALQALRQNGNTVTDLGSSTINGTSVEGYSVHVNPATIKKAIASSNLPAWMKQATDNISNPDVGYKVFVDDSDHLARMTTDLTLTTGGTNVSESLSMDFVHYGTPVTVTAPPPAEVAPFQSLLQAATSHASVN
jgi:hypothetical protein